MEQGLGMSQRPVLRQEQRLEQKQKLKIELKQVLYDTRSRISELFERNRDAGIPLKDLLTEIPQYQHDIVTYAIAGGWAVEVLTGKKRQHSNINAIMLDSEKTVLNSNMCRDYLFLQEDNSSGLKKNQIVKRKWAPTKQGVYVAGPEFLIATKVAPHDDNLPREKDLVDIIYLLETQPKLDSTKLGTAFGNYPELTNRKEYVRQLMQMHYGMQGRGSRVKQRYALDILSRTIADNIAENRERE